MRYAILEKRRIFLILINFSIFQILSNILSYLSVKELKELRLVSKLWNEEACKHLKRRATVFFDYNCGYEDTRESMKLFQYFAEMAHNPISNWLFQIPITLGQDDAINLLPGQPGAKLLADLLNLCLSDVSMFPKKLEFRGQIVTELDYEVRLTILKAVAGALQEFNWGGDWDLVTISGEDIPFPEKFQFHKLRVFTLSLTLPGEEDVDEVYNFTWLPHFIKTIQGVTTIRLRCDSEISCVFLSVLGQEMRFFSNLNEISIKTVTEDVIQLLLKLEKPLTKLELSKITLTKEDFQYLGKLLEKHCQTLKSLLLIIPESPRDEDDTPSVYIRFPKFPDLVKLNVGWNPGRQGKSQDVKLTFSDGSGGINFARDCPSLKSLTLWPTQFGKYPDGDNPGLGSLESTSVWKDCACFYEMFLPPIRKNGEMQICESLQFLDVLQEVRSKKGKKFPLFSKEAETRIANMFPNVRNNNWITSVREKTSRAKDVVKKGKKETKSKGIRKSVVVLRPRLVPGLRAK